MASLKEYFLYDARTNLTSHEEWTLGDQNGAVLGSPIARLHLDFEANAMFVSFYVPEMDGVECPEAILLRDLSKVLDFRNKTIVETRFGAEAHSGKDLIFTGQVYLYSERPVSEADRTRLERESRQMGHRLTFRSRDYVSLRSHYETPVAFISHDSRDKADIAQPLALRLSQLMLPVWYDDYTLKVGDSLRDSIEKGLKECKRCVLILTPNFLKNGGWSKREYDSIFTRELVEKKRLILPVWSGVSVEDVFNYSPVLADKVGVQWSLGVDEVARRLHIAIDSAG